MTSPNLIAPLKKRGAWSINGNTTATWLTPKLKPLNFRFRNTSAHALTIKEAKRPSNVPRSTKAPW
ncbi:hypothetical protein D3C81_2049760 [compost metagenome]